MNLVEFKNVYKEFKDGDEVVVALHETNFEIHTGEFIAIIGPSGSGKSTMLTLMGGLQQPTSGEIIINDKSYQSLSDNEMVNLRFHEIGFVLQASNLIPYLTIEEQFQFVDKFQKKKYQKEKAESLMSTLGILKLRTKYPSDLSGGERQRAAICRAIYLNPSLLLADEPTASLDSEKAFEVVQILKNHTKSSNKSTVMVTHDQRLLKYCDRIFTISDGYLSEVEDLSKIKTV